LSRHRSGLDRARQTIERDVIGLLGPGEASGLVTALSIGARDTLSLGTEHAFKATGLAHLLVVSGFQVTVVFHFVAGFIGWLFARSRWLLERIPVREISAVVGLVAALGFVGISGLEGASLRAGLAAVFVVVATVLERGRGMLNGILVSLVGVSTVWPGAFLEPGVQLTYAALLGICIAAGNGKPVASLAERIRLFGRLTVIVWVCSSAIAVAWFGTIAPLGLLLNPLIAPFASVVGCQGTFLGYGAYASGLDSNGAILALVATMLEAVRDIVAWCAEWGGVEAEFAGSQRLGWGLGLSMVALSAALARCRTFLSAHGIRLVE
jgi:competence protein ComEC